MARKRKVVRMLLEVTCPKEMTAAMARKQVRSLINDQCEFYDGIWLPDRYDHVEINMRVKKLGSAR